ncbi:MAG: hypothetical protein LBJ12_04520 [Oscillospiraceae bacterium]|nr:hypothetical protein [Oscillospiraceae bacterium]
MKEYALEALKEQIKALRTTQTAENNPAIKVVIAEVICHISDRLLSAPVERNCPMDKLENLVNNNPFDLLTPHEQRLLDC